MGVYIITDTETTTKDPRAELSINGSEVTITCYFVDEYVSCVLVCREYNSSYLTVKEYTHRTEFPVTVSVDNPERYTFAVFMKNGKDGYDTKPVVTLKGVPKGVQW